MTSHFDTLSINNIIYMVRNIKDMTKEERDAHNKARRDKHAEEAKDPS